MQIEQVSTEKLIPYANNARTHSEAQVAQIAASIRQFGFNNPVLIDDQSTIIAGHGRVLAAQKLELSDVPCVRLSHLTESQKKAYIIADNKIALNSGWDDELLKLELESLTDIEQIATGFSPEELNVLFEGWQSNIDLHEKDGSNLDGIMATIKVGVSQEEKEFALRRSPTPLIKQASSMSSSDDSPRLNLLAAYPYMSRQLIEVLKASQDQVRFVLDSGAFTAWKAGKPIALDDYCRFIDSLPFKPWRYFTLDVIGDPEGTIKNYETMLSRGYNPVPIFTRGERLEMLDYYFKTSDVVGIGGLVGTQQNKGFINGIMKHVGDRKVHWLGFTSTDYLKHYRPYMCDSSSWAGALIYGSMKLYDKAGRFITVKKQDFRTKPPDDVLRILREYEVDPAELAVMSNWKNSGKGDYPTEKVAFRSFVKYQRDITKNLKTKMFMAVASDWQARLAIEAYNFWERKMR